MSFNMLKSNIYIYHSLSHLNTVRPLPQIPLFINITINLKGRREKSLQRQQRILREKKNYRTVNAIIYAGLKRNYDKSTLRKKRQVRKNNSSRDLLWLVSSTPENTSNTELFFVGNSMEMGRGIKSKGCYWKRGGRPE